MKPKLCSRQRLELALLADDDDRAVGPAEKTAVSAAITQYVRMEGLTPEHFDPSERCVLRSAFKAAQLVNGVVQAESPHDEWTHSDLAHHLAGEGVAVVVTRVSETIAWFANPVTGGRVAVVRSPDRQTADVAARVESPNWKLYAVAGVFFIGVGRDGTGIDAALFERIRRVLE